METLKSLGGYKKPYSPERLGRTSPPIFWKNILQSSRFGEALRITQDKLNSKNFYAFNPGFDTNEVSNDRSDCDCNN